MAGWTHGRVQVRGGWQPCLCMCRPQPFRKELTPLSALPTHFNRFLCSALRACAPRLPPTAVRLALRCVLRHWRAQQAGGDAEEGGRYNQLMGLQHHWDELPDTQKLEFAQMGALAHQLLRAAVPEAAEAVQPRDLTLLIARFGCNSHTIRCVPRVMKGAARCKGHVAARRLLAHAAARVLPCVRERRASAVHLSTPDLKHALLPLHIRPIPT